MSAIGKLVERLKPWLGCCASLFRF